MRDPATHEREKRQVTTVCLEQHDVATYKFSFSSQSTDGKFLIDLLHVPALVFGHGDLSQLLLKHDHVVHLTLHAAPLAAQEHAHLRRVQQIHFSARSITDDQ